MEKWFLPGKPQLVQNVYHNCRELWQIPPKYLCMSFALNIPAKALHTEFPWLLESLDKPGIYFGSLNPGNSLEFCEKILNHLEICERQKIGQHRYLFLSKLTVINHFFRKIIDTFLECSIDQNKYMGEIARKLTYI